MMSAPQDTSKCTIDTCPLSLSKVGYLPNEGGNAFLAAWFGICLVAQLGLGIRYRTWSFLFGQFAGLILELIGYVARVKLHDNPFSDNSFITYIITVTIAPAFLCYTIYLCFGRVVLVYGEHISHIPYRAYTSIFVTMDVICLLLQAAGAALTQADDITPDELDRAVTILKAGLGMQVASLSVFILLSAEFGIRVVRKRNQWSDRYVALWSQKKFLIFLIGSFTAAMLILIRSAYRVEELKDGLNPGDSTDEILFMVFEGAMIGLSCILQVIFHPGPVFGTEWKTMGFFVKRSTRESTHIESGTELRGQSQEAMRARPQTSEDGTKGTKRFSRRF